MSNLKSSYSDFYDILTPFIKAYPSYLKDEYKNGPLKDIDAILYMIPKDSDLLSTGPAKLAKQWVTRTLDMTQLVLAKSSHFLTDDGQTWLAQYNMKFKFKILMVQFSVGYAGTGTDVIEQTASGIGGGNTSTDGGPSSSTLIKIKEIAKVLNA